MLFGVANRRKHNDLTPNKLKILFALEEQHEEGRLLLVMRKVQLIIFQPMLLVLGVALNSKAEQLIHHLRILVIHRHYMIILMLLIQTQMLRIIVSMG